MLIIVSIFFHLTPFQINVQQSLVSSLLFYPSDLNLEHVSFWDFSFPFCLMISIAYDKLLVCVSITILLSRSFGWKFDAEDNRWQGLLHPS